jgi:hypothetical protein
MSFSGKSVGGRLPLFIIVLSALFLPNPAPASGFPDLVVRIGDTTGLAGSQGVAIPVRMNNYYDTVAAFEIRVTSDRPDLISFQRSLDTVGSLVSGWELVATEYLGDGDDTLRIIGIANQIYPIQIIPGIGYPQLEPTPLVRLLVDVAEVEDTLEPQSVNIRLLTEDPLGLIFSDEEGYAIGILTDTIIDTTWFVCVNWADPEHQDCLQWEITDGPPADSFVIDSTRIGWLDTSKVFVYDGTLRINPGVCGDVSRDDGKVTLSDIAFLIGFVYLGGPEPPSLWAANVNGSFDGMITLSDIARMIDHVYISKGALYCR